jgi:hypothetical protein
LHGDLIYIKTERSNGVSNRLKRRFLFSGGPEKRKLFGVVRSVPKSFFSGLTVSGGAHGAGPYLQAKTPALIAGVFCFSRNYFYGGVLF